MNFVFTFIFQSTFTQVPYSYRLLFCNTGNLLKTLDTPRIFILLSFMPNRSCAFLVCKYVWHFLWLQWERKDFFLESFILWCPLLMIALYHQIKTPISFWCRWGLNPRSLIQPLETLPVELTGTHNGREKIWTWNISLKNIKSYQSMELQSFKHVYHVLNKISFLQSNLSRQNI